MDYRERWELKDFLIGQRLERRVLLFQVLLTLVLLGFLLNFWYLQGVQADHWADLAENNRLRRIPIPPSRGEILDRHGEVIASTRPSLSLVLRREGGHDLAEQLRRLAPIVDVPYDMLAERLASMRGRPLYEALVVKADVSLAELARIGVRRERFPSVEVRQTPRRHYLEGGLAAHAVGYVGQVGEAALSSDRTGRLQRGDIVGKSGLERRYDDTLGGERGWMLVSVNNLGRQIGEARVAESPYHGEPIRMTLDLAMQRALVEGLGEEAGAGVFIDARTGEVLAIASTPTFDPNLFADGFTPEAWEAITTDPRRPLHDRAIASFYAPGSTFKVIMAVAGLETGTVRPSDTVYCPGHATFYGRRRLCWKRGGHGTVDLQRAVAESCNVYFYTLGQKLGIDAIEHYSSIFGLGTPTGIDMPGEVAGVLPSREWKQRVQGEMWYPGDTISVAIGQGLIAVTPVQMAHAMATVGNGGVDVTPHLRREGATPPRRLPLSPSTLHEVQRAMARTVERGTGRRATTGRFTVAGKTGTAQVYKHSAGIDSNDLPKDERDHAWFAGYSPAESPRVAFAVVVEHGGHGGETAAPIVRSVLEAYFAQEDDRGASGDTRADARGGRRRAGDVRAPSAR